MPDDIGCSSILVGRESRTGDDFHVPGQSHMGQKLTWQQLRSMTALKAPDLCRLMSGSRGALHRSARFCPAYDRTGQFLSHAPAAKNSEPFRPQTTAKSVTDLPIGA